MKRLFFPAVFVIAAAGYFFLTYTQGDVEQEYLGEADAKERIGYEWEMLHDPATGKIPANIREKELAFAAGLPGDGNTTAFMKTTGVSMASRGPWNVGGRTRAFAVDITNPNVLVAGAASGGMWRSVDDGQSWSMTTSSDHHKSVSCVAQDKRTGHANIWYYGTGEGSGASASASGAYYLGDGIYKSIDSGKTWTILPSTTSPSPVAYDNWADIIWSIVTDPSNTTQDVVVAAAYGGIYRTVDGGTNWTSVLGGGSYYTDIVISSSGVIYVSLSSDGSTKGIFRSVDGVNFTNITPPGFAAVYDRVKIGISPSDENQLYFLGNTPGYGLAVTDYQGNTDWHSFWKYTYVSGDGTGAGGVWEDRSLNLPSTGGPFDKYQSQGSYDMVVKVKPDDANVVFIGGTNLYRSTSGFADTNNTEFIGGYLEGATLPVVKQYLNHHPDQHEVFFSPTNPNKMYSANDGGIYVTTDPMTPAVTWTSLNNGYLTTMFYTVAIDHATTDDVMIGGAQDNGSWYTNSSSPTDPWVTPRGGDGSYCAIADNKTAFYLSIQNGKMMKAKLSAAGTVDSFARIDPIGAQNYMFINPYTLDPNNNNIMYLAAGKFLWRNNDLSGIPYASNWDSISTNWVKFPDSMSGSLRISAVAVATTPANRVYFGTNQRRLYRIDNAHTGTPASVEITSTGLTTGFPAGGYISSIAVDPSNGDHVMVTFSNYGIYSIYYTDNGGTSWSKVAGNLEETATGGGDGPSVRWARIMPVAGGTVYLVGTSVGLFATTELNGLSTTWVRLGSNTIGSAVVTMIDSRATDGLVAVATHSHGIYSGYINSVNDVTDVNNVVPGISKLALTNYPNPFRDETTIQFTLPKRAHVQLVVYNGEGKLVQQIANAAMDAGEKKFTFSASKLTPGIYHCILRAGGTIESRKIEVR